MIINSQSVLTIWHDEPDGPVFIIDQTRLPERFEIAELNHLGDAVAAIAHMQVRGAPLIGATAAYGLALACRRDASDPALKRAGEALLSARPTAINLAWAVERVSQNLASVPVSERASAALRLAQAICEEDIALCSAMGDHGVQLIRNIANRPGRAPGPVNILTHCNAGALATLDWGTATAPIYKARQAGIDVHVWVDETRPRNQGALTAWELAAQDVPHTFVVDNAGGHLMQHGQVDLCLVGTDRTTASGDVCNKIGTYLKALAAHDNQVPFYVCAPSPSIDWSVDDGLKEIPIEQRDDAEVRQVFGRAEDGTGHWVSVVPEATATRNDAFDVTPARLVTGLITERGIATASRDGLATLFPDLAGKRAS
ncbi:MAG: S-methyl-5-thioribose-1-phosphate isomerase [Pseudomonadota bacterium]